MGFEAMNYAVATDSRESAGARPPTPAASIDPKANWRGDIVAAMHAFLADVFALYLKTKSFHWHLCASPSRESHRLLHEQADEIFAMTDPMAERIRNLGGSARLSIGLIARTQRVLDNDDEYVEPPDMLSELREDNRMLAARLRDAHNACYERRDIATGNMIKVWIDEADRRTRRLLDAARQEKTSRL